MKPAERMREIHPASPRGDDVTGASSAGARNRFDRFEWAGAFGTRAGGAPTILDSILLVLAIFFSGSIQTPFRMFPTPILGVILSLAGAQFAWGPGASLKRSHRTDRIVMRATAVVTPGNVGMAFVVGLALDYAARRGSPRA